MTDHSDLIRRLVIPMVRERSREPGDAWHQAEQALSSQSLSLSEALERCAGWAVSFAKKCAEHQEALREIERLKGLVAGIRETDATYVIWSNEHRAWWGPDRRGYCSRLADAGRYDRESALGVCIGARGGRRYNDNPSEVMVLFEDACLFWPDDKPEWREARARWNAPLEEPFHD